LSVQRALITGGSGFVGRTLLAGLDGIELHATSRNDRPGPGELGPAAAQTHWHELDITDPKAVDELLAALQPQLIVHLAAQTHVPTSFTDPDTTWAVNLHGSLNLLRATRRHCAGALVLHVGSSDPYGASFLQEDAVTEDTPFLPLNPYAASKAAADLAAYQAAASDGLRVLRARPFNHSGPGQAEGFVLPGFAAQIARIEAGKQAPVLRVGDLSTERDFLHVEDVVSAYLALINAADRLPAGSAWNIASGRAWRLDALLQSLLARSHVDIRVETDPERLRRSDIPRICGSHRALQQATGWQPRHSMDSLLEDLLGYWRQRIGGR
jgi:GDP-4-dehydro-6-deoxy-D-mannose reductase